MGIIALEIMPISSRMAQPMFQKDVLIGEIAAIVKHHRWKKFVLVSHSYGSAISTYLIKSPVTSPFIGPVVLIDPITFLLHLPDVAYNFTIRRPLRANEHQLWYFAGKDPGVAHTLGRRFFWSDSIIWKEDLGVEETLGASARDTTVVLGGKDLIVDTGAVRRYLETPSKKPSTKHEIPTTKESGRTPNTEDTKRDTRSRGNRPWKGSGLEVIWFEDLDHAQVFDSARTRKPVVEAVQFYTKKA